MSHTQTVFLQPFVYECLGLPIVPITRTQFIETVATYIQTRQLWKRIYTRSEPLPTGQLIERTSPEIEHALCEDATLKSLWHGRDLRAEKSGPHVIHYFHGATWNTDLQNYLGGIFNRLPPFFTNHM